jgi:hypothetical protein
MIAHPQPQLMTPQDYLEWESQQPIKYEYINGQVFAMTGGTLPLKKTKIWLWTAVDNFKQGILGWVLGAHSAKTFAPLWDFVKLWQCYF